MVIGIYIYIEHSLQRPSEGQWFNERLQCSVPISEQQVNCQKLDDQQNGAHQAPQGHSPANTGEHPDRFGMLLPRALQGGQGKSGSGIVAVTIKAGDKAGRPDMRGPLDLEEVGILVFAK